MPLHPNVRRCLHTKLNGNQCGSPALTGAPYCHFHADVSQRRRTMKVPNLESTADVQQAITETIRALLEGRIDRPRANSVLYGLHLAQRTFAFNKLIDLKRDEDVNAAERSVVQKLLDEVQPIAEFEQQMEADEASAAQAAQEAAEEAQHAAADSARAADEARRAAGRELLAQRRAEASSRPHHFTDDIPRDEEGYLKPTRKQEAEIDRMVMELSNPKKTG
jgi:hypothetical protein